MIWALIVALLVITVQVFILRRNFPCPAWNLKAAGFAVFALLIVSQQFSDYLPAWAMNPTLRRAISLGAYALLISGYELFRRDVIALRRKKKNGRGGSA